MPQMSPLNWLSLMIYFLLFLFLMNIFLFYMNMSKIEMSNKNNKEFLNNWKW